MLKMALVFALTSSATILTACSGGADEPAPVAVTAPAAATSSDAPEASTPSCPSSSDDAGSRLTPSPVAACVGNYGNRWLGGGWLHRTAQGCLWRTDLVLHENGDADELTGEKRTGTWKGDELYFTLSLADSTYEFSRSKDEPSK
jgi:hypothetical protein